LVVEDYPDTLEVLSLYLSSLGCAVGGATTVREALHELSSHPWDMLISDIALPDGTGWDIMERLPEMPPLFAVSMSAYRGQETAAKSRTVGFRQHMEKPIMPDVLEGAVAACHVWKGD
jgi:CheY-like chemotaxis protein